MSNKSDLRIVDVLDPAEGEDNLRIKEIASRYEWLVSNLMRASSTALVLSTGETGSEEIIVIDPSDLTKGMASGIRKMNLQNLTREALQPGDLGKVLAVMEQSNNPKVAGLLQAYRQGIANILGPTKE